MFRMCVVDFYMTYTRDDERANEPPCFLTEKNNSIVENYLFALHELLVREHIKKLCVYAKHTQGWRPTTFYFKFPILALVNAIFV